MTPKEALTIIKLGYVRKDIAVSDRFFEAHEMVETIINKAETMKPVVSNGLKVCPKCFSPAINGSIYDHSYRCNKYFCPEKDCGQAIDWSDEK